MRLKLSAIGLFCFLLTLSCGNPGKEVSVRQVIPLNSNWKTMTVSGNDTLNNDKYIRSAYADTAWQKVNVPHNWDRYEGFRRNKHGNRHGTAWYRKELYVDHNEDKTKRYFLFFEGVGSYATVWVNGKKAGEHWGGRTTFTLDITKLLHFGKANTIAVKAEHPAFITDLPWVCGGCSGEWGFSEGSQPMGIFRPVSLVVTNDIRIEPFGVHIWNDENISKEKAKLFVNTEIRNYRASGGEVRIVHKLHDTSGKVVARNEDKVTVEGNGKGMSRTERLDVINPELWSPGKPYLYQLSTVITDGDTVIDEVKTSYGIRRISWPVGREGDDGRFFINGEPLFINGTCEYEHLMGRSHAFTDRQVRARVEQVRAAGFNAFREAHQPHNLRYQQHLDKEGILFWSQFSAHIWYDTPEFRKNFKTLLRQWIRERRNSPSVVLWGLQNESVIPKEFAEECTRIIREMDPTASAQRKVTTCNGGEGTDWNVIQNWSGTYGGDPFNYGNELSEEWLNGEYGAWRTADLHTEGPFRQKGKYSEDRFSKLMEIKVKQAESVRDKVAGQFNWLFASHENPGRIQNGEAYRDMDRVGPVNYKGLFTVWGEPLDAYYMYMANYAPVETQPMAYIVSHSWPDRWTSPGIKDSITVYSNCDEVELFNGAGHISLGKKKNPGRGKHFQWDDVPVKYNILYAVGYEDGKEVATDCIVLDHLPGSPDLEGLKETDPDVLKPEKEKNYIYRVNAGGPGFTDTFGNTWAADVHKSREGTWGSLSWTDDFENLPDFYASQRRVFDPIRGTANWDLFRSFRYGTDRLQYEFPVEKGNYTVELFFIEPWYGTTGTTDCTGWRNFDVAINDSVVLKDLDIWKEAGHDTVLKKTFTIKANKGILKISFPEVASGQAVISAIAIAAENPDAEPAPASPSNIVNIDMDDKYDEFCEAMTWLDRGQKQYSDTNARFLPLPYKLYGGDWLRFADVLKDKEFEESFIPLKNSNIYVLLDETVKPLPKWLSAYENTGEKAANNNGSVFNLYRKRAKKGETVAFGPNGNRKDNTPAAMYTIITIPEYRMDEGENSRPVFTHEAEEADISGQGTGKGHFKKEDYITFPEKGNNSITWEVNPGLAGEYLLRFRYMNMGDSPVQVRLQIESADGILLKDDEISFPVADRKWRILNTTTGGYINAGTYKVSLSAENMEGLRLDKLEFQ
ncbi:DUF4982 domain-containing protein [Sinomicrobium kalidii]|uniref:malectin domain-containing carbohydrate-binding protein n=1 Tax=Sinomicrobium kalidii TaxID=2900738 RepID=UPI001E588BCB|nr:malectin domain-containing carbohydrate-binding protein [Sinomicrobium kalidii]UGU15772.1 DUF4982 domain-containing protein [Sinomicrobium kalidii]